MQKKVKLLDLAKDLNVDKSKIIDVIAKYNSNAPRKKPSSQLSEGEVNLVLEHFTQKNQVSSFDNYANSKNGSSNTNKDANSKSFDRKNSPQQGTTNSSNYNKSNNSNRQDRTDRQGSNRNYNGNKFNNRQSSNGYSNDNRSSNSNYSKNGSNSSNNRTNGYSSNGNNRFNSNNGQNQNANKANATTNKSATFKTQKPQVKSNDTTTKTQYQPKPKTQAKPHNRGEKTQLNVNISSSSMVAPNQTIRTVDTRSSSSYIDLDKYNERYEQIAPANRQKDNYSKKQKITQKSAQKQRQKYSTKKETETEKLRRLELERARKQQLKVLIPDEIVVSELASRLKVTVSDVIKKLMGLGIMASINETVDFDTASLIAEEFNAKVEKEVIVTIEERLIDDSDDDSDNVEERCPVVVVMGHVDHGKTSILDRIRHAHVTASEAGGITQHIGAYQVNYQGKDITFLDTPGHEAFTSMRARGANITDIAVLVVAGDDGIMPQTIESINHAKAAGVTLIVAINKMDVEGANADRVKQELTEQGIVCEEWGGDTICVPVSAKTGEGIDELLENILLVAEVKELKANPNRLAKGAIIEAKLDKGRGPVATILVQNGTLHQGDVIIAGTSVGRVRVMTNDKGKQVTSAGPSVPVEITGLAEVPSAGDTFNAVEDEKLARELVEQRKHEAKQQQFKNYQKVTLDNLFSQIEQGEMKELPIIVKADVQGSVEAVKQSLEKLSNDEVRVKVIHGAVGAVSESDVMLASVSNAIIVGFNVRPDPVASESAERDGVDIRLYRVIYDAIDEVSTAMKGMLAPKIREVQLGRAEVRQVYKISNVGQIAGSYVLNGKITRSSEIRVVRDGIVIAEDKIDSLKRFKDDAKEVASGYECGIGLTKFNDIKEGDILEAFIMEEYRED